MCSDFGESSPSTSEPPDMASYSPIGAVQARSFYTYGDLTFVPSKKGTHMTSPPGSVYNSDCTSDSSSDDYDESDEGWCNHNAVHFDANSYLSFR